MLERTHMDWWLAMFDIEVYFDDSGTDAGTPVAVAACYVATKGQWDEFVREWDIAREREGFDVFHMAEFVAKPEMGHKPFCDWDTTKKTRVYNWLATIINTRVRKGFAHAVPKQPFDEHVFPEFRGYAQNHYVWAVKFMIGLLEEWRRKYNVTSPMQYVFDRGSLGQEQLHQLWQEMERQPDAEQRYGIVPDGVMFQNKAVFKPLQAADILAWQAQNHMRRTIMVGHNVNDRRYLHPGFELLRRDRPLDLCFHTPEQMRSVFEKAKAFHSKAGIWPWEQSGPIAGRPSDPQPSGV